MSNVKRFMEAFEGSTAAHGHTTVGNTRRNGKTEAKSFVVREPLTEQNISEHLSGKAGIGAIPIRDDNKCKFGAIDIDTYPIDHQRLVKKLEQLKAPMIVCRSKSGGAHLFLFLDDWYLAVDVREYLIEIAAAIGHAGCEIFPKQDQILVERGDVGNFINLPYFEAESTTRYAVQANGDGLELEQFLDLVEQTRVGLSDLEKIDFGTQRELFSDAPPCLQLFLNNGIPEGTRNKVMFNVGTYLKMKYPEAWKSHLEEINQKHCTPPLPATEIVQIQGQLDKKDYGYQCKEEPLCSHCNKSLCKSRQFGIGKHDDTMPSISGLTILLSEPRLYFLDVDGKRLELSTKQLQIPLQFQEACMEQLNYMPPLLKPSDWQPMVNEMMMNATTIEVPEELTTAGQFKELVFTFCTSRIRAMSPEELELGKPWTEDGKTYFKIKGLQEFLRQRGFTKYTRPQMQERLKEMNGDEECNKNFQYKTDKGDWKKTRVWWIDEVKDSEVELPTGGEFNAIF
jgi:hypothetical protein